jgi:hypothetical protein
MSAAVAHADPSFVLAESQARAGDVVHFSITGADDRVTYELEVADREVLKGEADADGGVISGQFTVPHLGGTAKSVEVEAEIREPDDKTTVTRKLQYLGPALAAPAPAAPQPAAAPVVPQPTAAAPAPAHIPAATQTTPSAAPAVKHRSKRVQRRHPRRARRTNQRHRPTRSNNKRATRGSHAKPKRTKRHTPRTAPLFDGVPEPDTGGYSAGPDEESTAREAGPPAAVLTTPVASREGGEPAAAILVPGLLGLAGFILAAATLLRRRRSG